MKIKKMVVDALAFIPTSKGFTGGEARRWEREVFRRKTRNYGFKRSETRWAIRHGFLPEQVKELGITTENVDEYISAKDYAYLRPLNGGYSKWITDRVTMWEIFKPFREYMPKLYFQLTKRYMDTLVIPLSQEAEGKTIIDIIKEKGQVSCSLANETGNSYGISTITDCNGSYLVDGEAYSEEELLELLYSYRSTVVIREKVETSPVVANGVLNLIVFNEYGDNPVIGDAYITYGDYEKKKFTEVSRFLHDTIAENDNIDERYSYARADRVDEKTGKWRISKLPYWDEIVETINKICLFVPQLEFFGAEIVINKDGFKIINLVNHPEYPTVKPFSKDTSDFLKKKLAEKKAAYRSIFKRIGRGFKKLHSRIRRRFARMFFPKNLVPYQSTRWMREVVKDFFRNRDASIKEKFWAYKRGFLSYRIKQYGITDENRDQYIADFEYRWLRHINPKYRKWMEDKITVKYIVSSHKECFPEYYYHISCKNGENRVISMMDLPDGYTNNFEEVFRLVEEKKVLALKPDEGSHGDGFYKFTFNDGKYELNYKEATKEEILNILTDVKNKYLVTEYIAQCDTFNAIYDGSVNTVRMLVYKPDGVHPEIGNAYIRIGSKKTGAVDNVGAGGMTVHIDVETGKFDGGTIAIKNQIHEIYEHPDTLAPLKGTVPHWEQVKEAVLGVAYDIKQLEWFGFDLAVTNDGIKFPEINRFPDFPSVEKYSEGTRKYLLSKLEAKKIRYGYEDNKNRTLVHLPRR